MVAVSVSLTGDWTKMNKVMQGLNKTRITDVIDASMADEAKKAAVKVRDNIDSGGALGGEKWKELSPLTLAMSPNARPLIGKDGEMRDAVTAKRVRKGQYMVGIPRGSRGKTGVDLSLIGAVHENGAQLTIVWTPQKIRAFWALVGKFLGQKRPYVSMKKGAKKGAGTTAVIIPARPFLRPMLEKMRAPSYGLKTRVQQHFMRKVLAVS